MYPKRPPAGACLVSQIRHLRYHYAAWFPEIRVQSSIPGFDVVGRDGGTNGNDLKRDMSLKRSWR